MIPRQNDFLSFLMAADAIADEELTAMRIDIAERFDGGIRGLVVPRGSLGAYKELIRLKLEAGFWNETVGRREIHFQFKLVSGALRELAYSAANEPEISALCSELNSDPVEQTSDVRRYLASNPFYRELMINCHGVGS